jgi:hypothetical protein
VNLTPAQVDANFYELATRTLALETTPPSPVQIDHFTVTGNKFTITMDDATVHGPFTLPVAVFRFREEYAEGADYLPFDLFTYGPALYLVLVQHIAPETFDPAAQDESTEDEGALYQKVFGQPDPNVDEVSGTSYTPVLADNGGLKLCTNVDGCEVTIPAEAEVAFPIGASLSFSQEDEGAVSILADDGVTIDFPATLSVFSAEQFSVVTVIKKASDRWGLAGHLAAA